MLGHHRDASKMPFKWRFTGGPTMARLKWYFDHLSSHQLKEKRCQSLTPLTKVSGSAHDWDVMYQLK